MIPEWLLSLAASGGSALVGAAATDAWQYARSGVARLFGHAGPRRAELAERWADETANSVVQASDDQRGAVQQRLAETWRQRLTDLVQEYPEVADELRSWAQQVQQQLPAPQQTWVTKFVARDHATQYNAPNGSITINQHVGGHTAP